MPFIGIFPFEPYPSYIAEQSHPNIHWNYAVSIICQPDSQFSIIKEFVSPKKTGFPVSSQFSDAIQDLSLVEFIGSQIHSSLSFGFHGLAFDASDDYDGEDRFILDNADSISGKDIFKWRLFTGGAIKFEYDSRDNKSLPKRGIHFEADIRGYNGLNDFSDRYTRFTPIPLGQRTW